ncbi:MAG: hypothetical protein GY719_41695 [bacterium]|nr:hypothetical protein [bacterium]
MEVAAAQTSLVEIVRELRRLDKRLARLARDLPVPEDEERMLEGEIPPDPATEVRGTISYCREDQLRHLIEYLEAASRVAVE